MRNSKRVYDVDFNPNLCCFEFYIIKEKETGLYSIEAYLLGRLYKKNGNFILKVLNGIYDTVLEEEVCSFGVVDEEEAIQLSKKSLDLFLV